jgi:hypothetical protein
MGASKTKRVTNMILGNWDSKRPRKEVFDMILGETDRQIIWGGNYFADLLPASRCWLIWHKRSEANGQTDFADAELAWTSLDANVRLIAHEWNGFRRQGNEARLPHPTQKPTGVFGWCVQLAGAVTSIIDPYMGSGTALRVAKDLDIPATGIEINEQFCEMAAKRLDQEVFDFGPSEQPKDEPLFVL